MPTNPPTLPGTLTRPDAQRIIDALNLRLHEAETNVTSHLAKIVALEAKFPVVAANIASNAVETAKIKAEAVTDEKLAKPIIGGAVKANGEKEAGTGFTSEKTAAGLYKITLTNELATIGAMVALPVAAASAWRQETGFQKKTFTLQFTNLAGAAGDAAFTFLVKAT